MSSYGNGTKAGFLDFLKKVIDFFCFLKKVYIFEENTLRC